MHVDADEQSKLDTKSKKMMFFGIHVESKGTGYGILWRRPPSVGI